MRGAEPGRLSPRSAASAAAAAGSDPPGVGGGAPAGTSGGRRLGRRIERGAASLAMRTQTIQLLRDGYYRLCEAYMNGAIDQHQYNIVLLNIDRVMVTLLGVDGIAGTKNVAPVSISPAVPPRYKTARPAGAEVRRRHSRSCRTDRRIRRQAIPINGDVSSRRRSPVRSDRQHRIGRQHRQLLPGPLHLAACIRRVTPRQSRPTLGAEGCDYLLNGRPQARSQRASAASTDLYGVEGRVAGAARPEVPERQAVR